MDNFFVSIDCITFVTIVVCFVNFFGHNIVSCDYVLRFFCRQGSTPLIVFNRFANNAEINNIGVINVALVLE